MPFKLINLIRHRIILVLFSCATLSLSASEELYYNAKVIIFDCDGVLVDTEYLKFLAWREALENHNIIFSLEEYMPLVGHSSKNILSRVEHLKDVKLPQQIIDLKNHTYKTLQKQGVQPIQPMVDLAHALSKNKERFHIKLGLASSASREEILINLEQIGLNQAFDIIISGSDDLGDYVDEEGKNKPKPYIYIEAAKRLNVLPETCLVFEDTTSGVEAAAGAGMTVLAVPNQFTIHQDFSKATAILTSYHELPRIEIFEKNLNLKTKKKE